MEWINVKEKVPSETKPVLVLREETLQGDSALIYGITAWSINDHFWYKDWNVKFWMELPAKPENVGPGKMAAKTKCEVIKCQK